MSSVVVLVAGLPGVGKSTFCKRFALDNGWVHLDIDSLGRSESWPNKKLRESWNASIQTETAGILIRACEEIGNVIIDWGFPIHFLSFVQRLAQLGVRIVWFDADVEAAREAFGQRGTVPLAAFDAQMRDLASIGVPTAIDATVIRVLEKGRQFKRYEQIVEEIAASSVSR